MCFEEVCHAFIVASQNRIVMRTTLPCSLLALSPEDVLPAVYLCTNKIAADHENMVRFFSSVAFTPCMCLLLDNVIIKYMYPISFLFMCILMLSQ